MMDVFRTIVHVPIKEVVLQVHLPLLMPSEQKSLMASLGERTDPEEKLDLMIAVREFHFLDISGVVQ